MMSAGWSTRAFLALSILCLYVNGELVPGGFQNQDPSDPDVIKAATFAVNGFNRQSNEEYDYKLLKIVSAESQVVAGIRYNLNVEVGRTDCKRVSTSEIASCDFIKDSKLAKTLLCTFSVLEVPWQKVKTLESSFCTIQL